MKKTKVYLDMDGTIADLYNQKNWLEDLIAEKVEPFANAKPMTTEKILYEVFPKDKYEIKILSMTPKNAKKEYCKRVEKAKDEEICVCNTDMDTYTACAVLNGIMETMEA